ncbi:hypothetical protein BC828DRAFT_332464, partial [Blastocladiella britannica]
MIILPAAAYIDQYRTIAAAKDTGTFNHATCGVLLVCNTLRVFYWLAAQFSVVLLVQSLVMIVAQLALLELCVRIMGKRPWNAPSPTSTPAGVVPGKTAYWKAFWAWPTFDQYLMFLGGLVGGLAVLHLLVGDSPVYEGLLGALALGAEATVPMPQAINNYRKQSTFGLSFLVIFSWFGGDLFKIFYYIETAAPLPFLLCGVVQFSVDVVICYQIIRY